MSECEKHGGPYWFQCSACRLAKGAVYERTTARQRDSGRTNRVELTGRKRETRILESQRSDTHTREYRCLDCGHVGWSRHTDLKYKEERDG